MPDAIPNPPTAASAAFGSAATPPATPAPEFVASATPGLRPLVPMSPDDLPRHYPNTRVSAIPRDPYCVFFFWEVTPQSVEQAQQRLVAHGHTPGPLALRVYDVTSRVFNGANAQEHLDILLDRLNGDYYLLGERAGKTLLAEVGLLSAADKSAFVAMAQSQPVEMPRNTVSGPKETQWMTLTPKSPTKSRPPFQTKPDSTPGRPASLMTNPLASPVWHPTPDLGDSVTRVPAHWVEPDTEARLTKQVLSHVALVEWRETQDRGQTVYRAPLPPDFLGATPTATVIRELEVRYIGQRSYFRSEHGHVRVSYGPWHVSIRESTQRGTWRVVDEWEVSFVWSSEDTERLGDTAQVLFYTLTGDRTTAVWEWTQVGSHAVGRMRPGASEQRLFRGASGQRRLGGASVWARLIAASEWSQFGGASEWARKSGASENLWDRMGGLEAFARTITAGASEGMFDTRAPHAAATASSPLRPTTPPADFDPSIGPRLISTAPAPTPTVSPLPEMPASAPLSPKPPTLGPSTSASESHRQKWNTTALPNPDAAGTDTRSDISARTFALHQLGVFRVPAAPMVSAIPDVQPEPAVPASTLPLPAETQPTRVPVATPDAPGEIKVVHRHHLADGQFQMLKTGRLNAFVETGIAVAGSLFGAIALLALASQDVGLALASVLIAGGLVALLLRSHAVHLDHPDVRSFLPLFALVLTGIAAASVITTGLLGLSGVEAVVTIALLAGVEAVALMPLIRE